MKNKIAQVIALFLCQAALAYAQNPTAAVLPACIPAGAITPICGLQGPEDLELLPGGKQILISQIPGGADHKTGGGLAVLNLADNSVQPLVINNDFKTGWGENSCTTPLEKIAPHGIHLSKRNDGRWLLLVVNHADRESIEMLELVAADAGFSAIWHGCVINNTNGLHNDVAATPDGGFIATVMLDKEMRARSDALTVMLSGIDTGYLVEWRPDTGMVKLPNSEAPFNNGVQISEDGKFAYFNAWTGKQVRQYDRKQQRVIASVDLPFHPDNLSLRADGKLIVAGIDELASWKDCVMKHSDFCLTAFSVAEIDTNTNKVTPLYHGDAGSLAGASVALQVNKNLYVGTYTGDRLLKITLAK